VDGVAEVWIFRAGEVQELIRMWRERYPYEPPGGLL